MGSSTSSRVAISLCKDKCYKKLPASNFLLRASWPSKRELRSAAWLVLPIAWDTGHWHVQDSQNQILALAFKLKSLKSQGVPSSLKYGLAFCLSRVVTYFCKSSFDMGTSTSSKVVWSHPRVREAYCPAPHRLRQTF